MLVLVGDSTKSFRPVDSLVRLVSLDSVYVRARQVSQDSLSFSQGFPVFVEFVFGRNRELSVVWIVETGVLPRKLINDIVERGAQVMNAITCDERQLDIGDRRMLHESDVRLVPTIIVLDGNSVYLSRGIGLKFCNDVGEMFVGAFDPFTCAVKGMIKREHGEDYPALNC